MNTNKETLVVEDMNIHLNMENKMIRIHEEFHEKYVQKILTKGIVQVVKNPTRYHLNRDVMMIIGDTWSPVILRCFFGVS